MTQPCNIENEGPAYFSGDYLRFQWPAILLVRAAVRPVLLYPTNGVMVEARKILPGYSKNGFCSICQGNRKPFLQSFLQKGDAFPYGQLIRLSVAIPVHNEESVLQKLLARVRSVRNGLAGGRTRSPSRTIEARTELSKCSPRQLRIKKGTCTLDRKIDFWMSQFGAEEKLRVAEVIDSGFLNDGDVTSQFERQVAEMLGCKHVVATTSGTSAIFLALASVGIKASDEVLVPDVTFIATANAVSLTGAKPVLVDVDPQNLNLDPAAAERAITPRTKAIIPVHVSGRAADVGAISDVVKRHGLLMIEDAAEALLSKHRGKYLGTFGSAGCFSLSPNKTITTGQGGLIATDDDQLHVRLRELKDQGRPARGTGGDDTHNSVGYNFKFTNLQAAIGLAQLKDLPRRADRMRDIYKGYRDGLRGVEGISVIPFRIDEGEVPQWTDVLVDRRDVLYDHLVAHGIRGRRFWHPLHTQAPYRMPSEQFPNSSKQIPRAMWLPSAFTLSDADVAEVCAEIQSFVKLQTGFNGGQRRPHAIT